MQTHPIAQAISQPIRGAGIAVRLGGLALAASLLLACSPEPEEAPVAADAPSAAPAPDPAPAPVEAPPAAAPINPALAALLLATEPENAPAPQNDWGRVEAFSDVVWEWGANQSGAHEVLGHTSGMRGKLPAATHKIEEISDISVEVGGARSMFFVVKLDTFSTSGAPLDAEVLGLGPLNRLRTSCDDESVSFTVLFYEVKRPGLKTFYAAYMSSGGSGGAGSTWMAAGQVEDLLREGGALNVECVLEAPLTAVAASADTNIAEAARPSRAPAQQGGSAGGDAAYFERHFFGKRWSIEHLPCDLNGGTYVTYTNRPPAGAVQVMHGQPQQSGQRQAFEFTILDARTIRHTHIMYADGNPMVMRFIGNPNAVIGEFVTDYTMTSDNTMTYKKTMKMANMDAMLGGALRYDNEREEGFRNACR